MKALIFSDSHTRVGQMCNIIEKHKDISYIFHAGDVNKDCEELLRLYPRKNIIFVRGNNDPFERDVPYDRFFNLFGKNIFLTHGHNYGVKINPYRLLLKSKELSADICIFGHTHARKKECIDGIWLFNPGSVACGSYGLLEIDDGSINFEFCE